jgi:uncharacterized protein YbaP (TraB family)
MESDSAEKSLYKKSLINSNQYSDSFSLGEELLRQGKIHKPIAEDIPRTSTFDLPSLFVQAVANFDANYFKINLLWEDGFDKQLVKRAMRDKKQISYLESPTERDKMLDTACSSKEDHLRMTRSLAFWLKSNENILQEMVVSQRLLASGNFTSFENYMDRRLSKYESEKMFFDCFVTPRNKNWIRKIYLDKEKYNNSLILVGASHLIRENSLLALFIQDGFAVENISLHN